MCWKICEKNRVMLHCCILLQKLFEIIKIRVKIHKNENNYAIGRTQRLHIEL